MSDRDGADPGHRCSRCGGLGAVYVSELVLGCPDASRDAVVLCNEHGAQGVLESVRGMAHG